MHNSATAVVVRACKSSVRILLVALLSLFAVCGNLAASSDYEYRTVASIGQSFETFTIQNLGHNLSINDHGWVAFTAQASDGRRAIFVAEPSGAAFTIHKLTETTTGSYGAVWINNKNDVAVTFRATAGGQTTANVRRYA